MVEKLPTTGPKRDQPIFLVVGVPGSGKSWACEQVKDKFHYVHHDLYVGHTGPAYLNSILKTHATATKPLLIEAPFSISQTLDPLLKRGLKVIPLVINESEPVLRDRYWKREKKQIPQGHLSRQITYANRAKQNGWFMGTSTEVLGRLQRALQTHS